MYKSIKQRIVASLSVLMLAAASLSVGLAPAHAVGQKFNIEKNGVAVLHGEPIPISQGSAACPGGSYNLQSVIVDSENHTYIEDIGTTSFSGYWTPRIIRVNPSASYGEFSLTIRCLSQGFVVSTSDTETLYLTPQTNRTTSIKEFGSNRISIMSTPYGLCLPYDNGTVEIYGSAFTSTNNTFVTSKDFIADSEGQWSVSFDLTGFSNTEDYYATWMCSNFNNNAYHFSPKYYDYVALGDSYSSGEGTFMYDVVGYGPTCHTSSDSYAYYVASVTSYGTPDLVACSGATTDDLWNYSPQRMTRFGQFDNLGLDTNLVTLTIGGNDAGFQEVLERCVHTNLNDGFNCRLDSYLPNAVNDRLAALAGEASANTTEARPIHSIVSVLEEIHRKSPNAKIYIGGYPHLFGDDSTNFNPNSSAPGGASCSVTPGGTVSYTDAQWMNDRADDLNEIISDAVDEVNLRGVDASYVPSNFDGHVLCDNQNLLLNPVLVKSTSPLKLYAESMHPTSAGILHGYGLPFSLFIN